jgi:hypothetical protein
MEWVLDPGAQADRNVKPLKSSWFFLVGDFCAYPQPTPSPHTRGLAEPSNAGGGPAAAGSAPGGAVERRAPPPQQLPADPFPTTYPNPTIEPGGSNLKPPESVKPPTVPRNSSATNERNTTPPAYFPAPGRWRVGNHLASVLQIVKNLSNELALHLSIEIIEEVLKARWWLFFYSSTLVVFWKFRLLRASARRSMMLVLVAGATIAMTISLG